MPPVDPRTVRSRALATAAALAASAAAHLVLLAALARTGAPAAVVRGAPVAVEVELVERIDALEVRAPRAGAPSSRVRAAAPEAGRAADPPSAAPAARDPGAPEPLRDGAPARGAVDLVAEGLAVAPLPGAAPDLRARPQQLQALEPGPGPAGAAPREETALERWASDLAGRARVESGLAHPYCGELGKALVRAWDAERILKARGGAGYLAQLGGNLKDFGRAWQRIAEGYARPGAPDLLEGGSQRLRELAGLPAGPAADALVDAELDRQVRRTLSEGHVATVRVVQAPDGAVRTVEIVAPSGDAAVDRDAVDAVRRAVAKLPAPPPEALAGRAALVTTWEFEIEVSITPPLPLVTVELDEVLGLRDVRVPLDRRIWKKVRLVAVG